MTTDKILGADLLDIIFEKRNKNYGAYDLRKFYNNRLFKSLGITMGVALLVCGFTFLPGKKVDTRVAVMDMEIAKVPVEAPKEKPIEPKKNDAPKEITKPKEVTPPAQTQQYTNHLVITKEPVNTKIKELTDSVQIGDRDIDVPGKTTAVVVTPVTSGDGGGNGGNTGGEVVINRDIPLDKADVMPQYPGGLNALRKFLERNLQNPEDLDEGKTVSVKVKFVVGYDGALKGFETVEDGGKAFNNEVVRVLKKMPNWIPGKSNGQNVSVFYVVPVKFTPAE